MVDKRAESIDHEQCVAFYAQRLARAERERVAQWLAVNPDPARRARRDAALERQLHGQYAAVVDEPIPQRLLIAHSRPASMAWARGLATAVVVVVASGSSWWLGNQQAARTPALSKFGDSVTRAAQQALPAAHAAANTPDPVAGGPDLSAEGYRVIARRRLAEGARPLTEFIYRNPQGGEVRVYAQNMQPGVGTTPRLVSHDGMSLARWAVGGVNYALVGDMAPGALQSLASNAADQGDAPVAKAPDRMPRTVTPRRNTTTRVGGEPARSAPLGAADPLGGDSGSM